MKQSLALALARSKKGFEKETLVLLTASVAILVFYLFFIKETATAAERSASVTACRASVARNANFHIRGFEFPTTLNCPAQDLAIRKALNDREQEQAKRVIADAMYDCWFKFGEGKLNLFSDEGTFCSVCAFVDVQTDKTIRGLPLYLLNNEIPDKSGRFYSDYLTGFETSKAADVLGQIKGSQAMIAKAEGDLPGNQMYAVLFVYAKGNDDLRKLSEHITGKTFESKAGLMLGALGGFTAGTTVAGGTAMIALATAGAVTGPPGWIIVGAAVVGGAAAGSVAGFFASPDKPEWASFVVLREWNGRDTEKILKNELGCTYYPSAIS